MTLPFEVKERVVKHLWTVDNSLRDLIGAVLAHRWTLRALLFVPGWSVVAQGELDTRVDLLTALEAQTWALTRSMTAVSQLFVHPDADRWSDVVVRNLPRDALVIIVGKGANGALAGVTAALARGAQRLVCVSSMIFDVPVASWRALRSLYVGVERTTGARAVLTRLGLITRYLDALTIYGPPTLPLVSPQHLLALGAAPPVDLGAQQHLRSLVVDRMHPGVVVDAFFASGRRSSDDWACWSKLERLVFDMRVCTYLPGARSVDASAAAIAKLIASLPALREVELSLHCEAVDRVFVRRPNTGVHVGATPVQAAVVCARCDWPRASAAMTTCVACTQIAAEDEDARLLAWQLALGDDGAEAPIDCPYCAELVDGSARECTACGLDIVEWAAQGGPEADADDEGRADEGGSPRLMSAGRLDWAALGVPSLPCAPIAYLDTIADELHVAGRGSSVPAELRPVKLLVQFAGFHPCRDGQMMWSVGDIVAAAKPIGIDMHVRLVRMCVSAMLCALTQQAD